MNAQRTLAFVGAHPDDETFSVGATLAHYAAAGVRVYYLCATRGEAGIASVEHMRTFESTGDMRWSELQCAAQVLGLTGVIHLGYRDSGMPGSDDNRHPQALIAAPLDQVARSITGQLRRVKPQVVITFDPIGGYHHPDHIAIHNATVRAFHAAGNRSLYPEAGETFQPQKLYFSVFPRRWLKAIVLLAQLFGQDPHRFGQNKDIDLASVASMRFPADAVLNLSREATITRDRASACHASQIAGGPRARGILRLFNRLGGSHEHYMRGYPPPCGRRETDLFEGVH